LRDPAQQRFDALFGPEFGHGKGFDLSRLHRTLRTLDAPHEKLAPVIHVAGTNGKGSAIAFMQAIAAAAGLRTHAFTKPHLFRFAERFSVAGAPAPDAKLAAAAEQIAAIDPGLTQFDAQVAAAFLLFSATPADLVLIETGMGGRTDSTNVLPAPAATIITPIGLDHRDALGETLAAIAAHKAGILKPGTPAILARQAEDARAVLEAEAARVGAPLYRQGFEWDAFASLGRLVVQTETRALDLPLPALHGAHQLDNAGLACVALMAAMPQIADEALAEGVVRAAWPGRLQPLTRGPFSAIVRVQRGEVWVDGGHNEHAAAALANALKEMKSRRGGANIAIVGQRLRKDAEAFLHQLCAGVDAVIATPMPEAHVEPERIAHLARENGIEATTAPTLLQAMKIAAQYPAPRVLICGSFLMAAEALAAESG